MLKFHIYSPSWQEILTPLVLVVLSFASPGAYAQEEAKIVAAMRKVERAWSTVVEEQTPIVSRCAEQTWGILRFSRGALVTIDVRRTDSLISPFRGIVRIQGSIETNNYSPEANGFRATHIQPIRTVCFKTLADAQNATRQGDWRPYNDKPRTFDFVVNYDVQQGLIRLSGGNEVFLNAIRDKLTLPENTKGWSHLLAQSIE